MTVTTAADTAAVLRAEVEKELGADALTRLDADVARAKAEVMEIITKGTLTSRGVEQPAAEDITEFGDLHDYCDANMLGGLCDEDPTLDALCRRDGTDEGNDRWIQYGNALQAAVHAWIVEGGHLPDPVCPDCGENPCHPGCLSGGGL